MTGLTRKNSLRKQKTKLPGLTRKKSLRKQKTKLPVSWPSMIVLFFALSLVTLESRFFMTHLEVYTNTSTANFNALFIEAPQTVRNLNNGEYPLRPLVPSHQAATDNLLTIALDSYGSCPENCRFAHLLLPPWVRFRYIAFESEVDLKQQMNLEVHNGNQQGNQQHLLIVARTNIIKLGAYAVERKQQTNRSVALFHMADERIHQGEIAPVYQHFDFVLRHYWSDLVPFHGMTLRALGNLTCSSSSNSMPLPRLPVNMNTRNTKEPKWGVHWLHLDTHSLSVDVQRSAASAWPIVHRPTNCSFAGRKDVKRSVGERAAMEEAVDAIPSMNCTVDFTPGFAKGREPFSYFNVHLGTTKIGLSPRGSAIETHRLTEIMRMGAVPALKRESYLSKTFRELPGIIGDTWTDVAQQMQWYLEENNTDALEALAQRSAQFTEDYQQCVTQDMDVILRGAFGMLF